MKKLTTEQCIEILDYWLVKAYNIKFMDVPEELRKSVDFYRTYPVSQELYDEWSDWAFKYIKEKLRCSKRYIKLGWWDIEFTLAPMVKDGKI